MEEVDKRLDNIAKDKKVTTKREILMSILSIIFFIVTSPYITILLLFAWITVDYDIDWLDSAIMGYLNFFDKFK